MGARCIKIDFFCNYSADVYHANVFFKNLQQQLGNFNLLHNHLHSSMLGGYQLIGVINDGSLYSSLVNLIYRVRWKPLCVCQQVTRGFASN